MKLRRIRQGKCQDNRSSSLTTGMIDNFDDPNLVATWRKLFWLSPSATIFQTPEYFLAARTIEGCRIETIVVYDEAEQETIAILSIEMVKIFYCLSQLNIGILPLADYAGILVAPGMEDLATTAIADYLTNLFANERYLIGNHASPQLDLLARKLSERGYRTIESVRLPCSAIALPDDPETFRTSIYGRWLRRDISRAKRSFVPARGYLLEQVERARLYKAIEALLMLWYLSWRPLRGLPIRRYRQLLRSCADYGLLDIDLLWHDKRPVAALGCLIDRKKSVVHAFLTACEKSELREKPGLYLYDISIGRAIAGKFSSYDFLRGAERYKGDFGAKMTYLQAQLLKRTPGRIRMEQRG